MVSHHRTTIKQASPPWTKHWPYLVWTPVSSQMTHCRVNRGSCGTPVTGSSGVAITLCEREPEAI